MLCLPELSNKVSTKTGSYLYPLHVNCSTDPAAQVCSWMAIHFHAFAISGQERAMEKKALQHLIMSASVPHVSQAFEMFELWPCQHMLRVQTVLALKGNS